MVGCDGAHSKVRHQLGLAFDGEDIKASWALADVKGEWPFDDQLIRILLHPAGPVSFLPLGDGVYRVDSPSRVPDERGPVTIEEIASYVEERGPKGTTVHDPVWLSRFFLHFRHA